MRERLSASSGTVHLLSPFPPQTGGLADYSAELAQYLRQANVDVQVLRPLHIKGIGMPGSWRPLIPFSMCASLGRQPQLLHLQTAIFESFPWSVLDLKILDRPTVVTLHEILALGNQRIYSQTSRNLDAFLARLISIYQRQLMHVANCVIVHSEFVRRRVLREIPRSEDKLHVIPHGVEVNVPFKRDYNSTGTLVFWGTVAPHKRLDILLEALAAVSAIHPSIRLQVIGDWNRWLPSVRRSIERILRLMNHPQLVGKIALRGYLPMEQVREVLLGADALVLPYEELNVSGVAAKCLAYGVPIIASDHHGFDELIRDRETGLRFRMGDKDDLARKILELLSSEELREKLGRNARRFARTRLDWRLIAAEHLKIYSELWT